MSGLVTNLEVIRQFFQPALRSTTVTLVSKKSGARFTYDIKCKDPEKEGVSDVWYVDLLTGPNNRKDFSPLAVLTLRNGRLMYFHAKKSRIGEDAPSAVALKWAVENIVIRGSESAMAQLEVWHEGKCGRCGGKLSVPESIALGLGPDCAEKV